MNVALYIRVSTEEQAQGHSLDSQEKLLRAWADREGWTISQVYRDEGYSGKTMAGRPAFMQLLRDVEAGSGAEMLLVTRYDRFARNVVESRLVQDRLAKHSCRVLSLQEPIDNTPSGFLMKGMHELLAEYYSVELSAKVATGKLTRAEKGLTVGDLPIGYDQPHDSKVPVINPVEGALVKALYERYAEGDVSYAELVPWLNREAMKAGIKPRSKHAKNLIFSKFSIRKILENPFYAGRVRYKGADMGKGQHEAIVEMDLFQRATAARLTRRRQATRARQSHPYLLAGVGVCYRCGSTLWGNMSRGHRYYRCSGTLRGWVCSVRAGARADAVEDELNTIVTALRPPAHWPKHSKRQAKDVTPVRGAKDALKAELRDRIARAEDALLEGLVSKERARIVIEAARAQLRHLDAESQPMRLTGAQSDLDTVQRTGARIRKLWADADIGQRGVIARDVFTLVAVDLEEGTVGAFVPSPALSLMVHELSKHEGPYAVCTWCPRREPAATVPVAP